MAAEKSLLPPETPSSPEILNLQDKLVILTGMSNPQLAEDVGHEFDSIIGATNPTVVQHPIIIFDKSGERLPRIETSVLGKDVLIVQPTAYNEDTDVNINDSVMEAFLLIDAAKKAGAKRVILAAANFGYARQDRISFGLRESNSASLLARLFETAGTDMIITVDLHQPATEGAFSKQWINLYGWHVFVPILDKEIPHPRVIIGPDAGSGKRADMYAKHLGGDMALAYKRRNTRVANKTETTGIMGDVKGKHAIVVDDIASGGGTLVAAGEIALDNGAINAVGVVTHAQLYGDEAIKKIDKSRLKEVYVADTVAQRKQIIENPKFKIITTAKMIADALYCILTDTSISARLNGYLSS